MKTFAHCCGLMLWAILLAGPMHAQPSQLVIDFGKNNGMLRPLHELRLVDVDHDLAPTQKIELAAGVSEFPLRLKKAAVALIKLSPLTSRS